MTTAAHISDADLVKSFVELRDYVKAKKDAFDEHLKQWTEPQERIRGILQARMDAAGQDSIKTPNGTAYKSTVTKFAVRDRMAFLNFLLDELEKGNENAFDMATLGVLSDPVKEFLESHANVPPPGVDVTQVVNLNIRKA